jgi:hypothetical protein
MIARRPGLDELVLPAQFGVRLLDLATGRVISDGIQVRLWPLARPERVVAAAANRTGIFIAHPLPTPSTTPPEPQTPWIVEVIDPQRRFLPLRFSAALPSADLHDAAMLSPPFDSDLPFGGVALFSAPGRNLPPGLAALSADLRDGAGRPAAWAVAEVLAVGRNGDLGPTLGWGMADQRGGLFVPIQPPRARSASSGADQPWAVRLQVRYAAATSGRPPDIPVWEEALRQPEVTPFDSLSPLQPLADLHVQAGRTLVVRTAALAELILDA